MKTFVMIPTYNEKENIKALIDKILSLKIKNLHIVVADDNSPDGTWKIVKEISKNKKNIHLLLRKKDRGRGFAGRDGFIYCLKNKADIVIEMDADMSHDPKYIPLMLKEVKNADLILGSRRVKGSKEIGRGVIRQLITYLANLYIRLLLGLKVKDCNSGYRCFKRKVLEKINLSKIEAKGPSIVQEVLFKAHLNGFKIKEIPITFVDREKGHSKLGIKQLASGYFMVSRLRFLKLIGEI
ncbi:MAG TPA: polyprenol monophosphomannose synthase [Candidatus Woesearchaeota archaeon]|jgi:dolichol-phosphate mannosyltransferase|nr:polyprenol monophosphomannose synthase [Candidatus Woesearchaeota archaeon]|tara:strand:- start:107 stop:823 length:717 start_codon:yes stop_codon:yes gene_type:complete